MPTVGEELGIPFTVGGESPGTFAERLIARLEPWNTGPAIAGKTDLERWCNAVGAMFQPALELAEEEGIDGTPGYVPPYGRLFDPTVCPKYGLPYLAQYVGVKLPVGGSEAEWRALLEAESGLARGTRGSLEAEVARVLGPGVPFTIEERTGISGGEEPYHFNVIVGAGKATPALYEVINSVKPAGLQYAVIEASNTWLNGVKKHWTEVTVTQASEMLEGAY